MKTTECIFLPAPAGYWSSSAKAIRYPKVTKSRLNVIMSTLLEVGYSSLQEDEQRICDAFDAGTLIVE